MPIKLKTVLFVDDVDPIQKLGHLAAEAVL